MIAIWACSGPGAGKLIAENTAHAENAAWISGAIFIAALLGWLILRRFSFFPLACGVLLAVHPAWTISALRGDCGYLKAGAAFIVTALAVLIVVAQMSLGFLAWKHRRTRNPFRDMDGPA